MLMVAGCTQPPVEAPTLEPIETPAPTEAPSPKPSPTPVPPTKPVPTPSQEPTQASVIMFEPPTEGDWVITEEQTVEGKGLILNGGLIVKAGASLTLRDVSLEVNCQHDG